MAIQLQTLPRRTQYRMRAVSAVNNMAPAFGGPRQRVTRMGSHWAMDVDVPRMNDRCCGIGLVADLVQGESETIIALVPEPKGMHIPTGAPLVNGAGQSGMVLNIDGLTPNEVIRKGKFLSLIISGQRFLYMVRSEVVATTGAVAVPIWPMLRVSPANNGVVELAEPKIEGYIAAGQEWDVNQMPLIGAQFSIEERE